MTSAEPDDIPPPPPFFFFFFFFFPPPPPPPPPPKKNPPKPTTPATAIFRRCLPGSGDRAVAAAIERAKATATRNVPVFDDLPVPADTANLREGANLNDALLALLPLVGVWRGEGEGHENERRLPLWTADCRLP